MTQINSHVGWVESCRLGGVYETQHPFLYVGLRGDFIPPTFDLPLLGYL